MKNYKIAAALIGSFVLGAGGVQMLHAQTKPPVYAIAMVNVKDQDGYMKEFLPKAQAGIKKMVPSIGRWHEQDNFVRGRATA